MPPETDQSNINIIEDMFVEVARGMIGAQRNLDVMTTGDGWSFALPKVRVEMNFGLQVEKGKKRILFIPTGQKRKELHTHQLRFSMIAVPEPPPVAGLDDMIEGRPQAYILQPDYLVPVAEGQKQFQKLAEILLSKDDTQWRFSIPRKSLDKQKMIKETGEEGQKILDALESKSDRNLVCFRLKRHPASYLIVRLNDNQKDDGLFLYEPDSTPNVTIYSYEGDDREEVSYEPLHRLAMAVRRSQDGAEMVRVDYASEESAQSDANDLQHFIRFFRDGYSRSLGFLATHAAINDDNPERSLWYDFDDAEASLSFSVNLAKDELDIVGRNFVTADSGNLIENRTVLRLRREKDKPLVEIEMMTPGFVLSGPARMEFAGIIADSSEKIASRFAEKASQGSDRETIKANYQKNILNSEFQNDVVVFLSHSGDEIKPEFLVIWPGIHNGKSRDFVFRCKLKEENKVEDVDIVMRLEDSLVEVKISLAGEQPEMAEQAGITYKAFHRFFNAVRIWRGRMI